MLNQESREFYFLGKNGFMKKTITIEVIFISIFNIYNYLN